ncbi:MAG: phosphatase PAP2 family protein [Roseobacter sp.]
MTLEYAVFEAINGFAAVSAERDKFFVFLSRSQVLKGLVPAVIFWMLWFAPIANIREVRIKIIAINFATVFGIFAGRILAQILPFRDRPIFHALSDVTIQHPFHLARPHLEWASSMPSDHATMFFALATGMFFLNRKIGLFLFVHAVMVISVPRIYLALHWPNDILAGALVGIIITLLSIHPLCRLLDRSGLADWVFARERLLYVLAFLATYGIATMYGNFWRLAKYVIQTIT